MNPLHLYLFHFDAPSMDFIFEVKLGRIRGNAQMTADKKRETKPLAKGAATHVHPNKGPSPNLHNVNTTLS